MDEARHVEVYHRYLHEKLGIEYPSTRPQDAARPDPRDSRWDMKFLGMQIMVEGLALAAFGMMRDTATNPLLRDLTAYVMGDEARHVAFGVLSLRELLPGPARARAARARGLRLRGGVLMRDRFLSREVWEKMGLDADECIEHAERSRIAAQFRQRLFSKIVPNVKSLGLLSARQRERFAELGILQFEHETTSDVDQEVEEQRRRSEEPPGA